MNLEIEVKLRIEQAGQPEAIRQRLASCAAVRLGCQIEHDVFFDLPDGQLAGADKALRMRILLDKKNKPLGCVLTFKGPRQNSKYKAREEIELQLDRQYHHTAQMLQRLGYQKVLEYQKRRESWHLDKCKVQLDQLPKLGYFVEIEGPNEKAISNMMDKLHLTSVEQESKTYLEMVLEYIESRKVRYLGFGRQVDCQWDLLSKSFGC